MHLKALLIKFTMCFAILAIILGVFYGVSFISILTITILLTTISYVVGDLFILPRFENWGATLADFGLAILGISFLGYYLFNFTVPLFYAATVSSLFLAGGEYFFHKYLATHIFEQKSSGAQIGIRYQTEISSEFSQDTRNENDIKK